MWHPITAIIQSHFLWKNLRKKYRSNIFFNVFPINTTILLRVKYFHVFLWNRNARWKNEIIIINIYIELCIENSNDSTYIQREKKEREKESTTHVYIYSTHEEKENDSLNSDSFESQNEINPFTHYNL